MLRQRWLGATTLCLMVLLSGCGALESAEKVWEVVKDPGIPVGDPNLLPSTLSLHAYARDDANPGFSNQPTPVVVKVFELNRAHRFAAMDFFGIVESPEETLGQSYVKLLVEVELAPGDYIRVENQELSKNTTHIGVLAEFIDLDTSLWRAVTAVSATGRQYNKAIIVDAYSVSLVDERE